MTNLLIEVDEAMKQERLEKLWNEYGGFLIGLIAVVILGTGANSGYKSWSSAKNQKQTALYMDVIKSDPTDPNEIIEVTDSMGNKLAGLAKINAAGIANQNGDTGLALSLYREAARNTSLDSTYRDLATYMATQIDQALSSTQKIAALETILQNKGTPWAPRIHLDLAVLNASSGQNYDAALAHLAEIHNDSNAPQSLIEKARSLGILYSLKQSALTEK